MKTLEEKIAVMTAHANGAVIEGRFVGLTGWQTLEHPNWNWVNGDYRVKQSLEDKVFEVYQKAAYPNYKGIWSPSTENPIRTGLQAVRC